MRRALAAVVLFGVLSCGGGGPSSPAPTPPTAPPPPAPPVSGWSVSGTLVDTMSRRPIPGATIAPTWDLASIQSGSDGAFELGATTNPPTAPYRLSISGAELLT